MLQSVATVSILSLSLLAAVACAESQSAAAEPAAPASDAEMAAYAIGYGIGRQIHDQGVAIPEDQLIAGLRAGIAGQDLPVEEADMRAAQQRFQQAEQERLAALQSSRAVEERAKGEAFLTENAAKEGVITLAPGLQYEVMVAGDGPIPKPTDTVTVHYRGTLLDGTEFDSSYARNKPTTFPLTQVVPGWTQSISKMPVGSKWKLYLGADMGYGDNPRPGGKIPPGATLVFEVELLEIGK